MGSSAMTKSDGASTPGTPTDEGQLPSLRARRISVVGIGLVGPTPTSRT